jgi:hypothetical protein
MSADASGPTLAERIQELGKAAFDPSKDAASREQKITDYEELIAK